MIKLKSGNIIGGQNIMKAVNDAVETAKKKFFLIVKNIYPKFSKLSDLDIKVKFESGSISVSLKTSIQDSFYQQTKFELKTQFLRILREELRKTGLEVA